MKISFETPIDKSPEYRVKILTGHNSGEVQKYLISRLHQQFINESNYDPQISFTISDDYNYLFIINNFFSDFKIKLAKSNVIGYIYEPPYHSDYIYPFMSRDCKIVYCCANKKYYKNNDNFVSTPSLMFYHLLGEAEKYREFTDFNKPKKLSICVSNLQGNALYDFRRELVYKILESGLDCDIYGNGWELNSPRYRGSPPDKAAALLPYEYSIAIENSIYDGYVTEKLFDCFLCNTVPLYYGTPLADVIYNPNAFYRLPYTDDISRLIGWLKDLVNTPPGSNLKFKKAVLQAKERYFKNYNLYDKIKEAVFL